MRREPTRRPGFSLAEVTVVLFVILGAVVLLLPGLMSGREAARRTHCFNNLRQICQALANYESEARCLPPGVVDAAGPVRTERAGRHASWVVALLPYLDMQDYYNVLNHEQSVYAAANVTLVATRLGILACPADPNRGPTSPPGLSNYAGCHHDVEAPIDADNHGVFVLNRGIPADQITDGLSFTIFVGEKKTDPAPADLGWASGTRATLRNTGTAINRTPLFDAASIFAPKEGPDPRLVVGGFGGGHRGGACFAFGDGSVRFVSEAVDAKVYRCLGHRDDGEMISDAAF